MRLAEPEAHVVALLGLRKAAEKFLQQANAVGGLLFLQQQRGGLRKNGRRKITVRILREQCLKLLDRFGSPARRGQTPRQPIQRVIRVVFRRGIGQKTLIIRDRLRVIFQIEAAFREPERGFLRLFRRSGGEQFGIRLRRFLILSGEKARPGKVHADGREQFALRKRAQHMLKSRERAVVLLRVQIAPRRRVIGVIEQFVCWKPGDDFFIRRNRLLIFAALEIGFAEPIIGVLDLRILRIIFDEFAEGVLRRRVILREKIRPAELIKHLRVVDVARKIGDSALILLNRAVVFFLAIIAFA